MDAKSAAGACWQWKPHLDGKVLQDEFGLKGRDVGDAIVRVVEWQLLHPRGTALECRAHISTLFPPKPPRAPARAGAGKPKADEKK
jgi:hypothetical protein